MKSLLSLAFLAVAVFSSALQAEETVLPTCDIKTLADAKSCAEEVALALPSYEESNDAFASKNKAALKRALKSLDRDSAKTLKQIDNADFVGAILLHDDEHKIIYYSFAKGNSQPVELAEINISDLEYSLVEKTKANDFILGGNLDDYDIKEEIEYALENFESNK